MILTKGADSHVFPLISKGPKEQVAKNVTDFSMSGFHTLIICKKLVEAEQGKHLVAKLRAAKTLVNNADRLGQGGKCKFKEVLYVGFGCNCWQEIQNFDFIRYDEQINF